MYNGIGLQTARGSGTNGYVQTNKFFVRAKTAKVGFDGSKGFGPDQGTAGLSKKPNTAILEHDRKRQIELKVVILEDKLSEEGYTDAEISVKVSELREKLEAEAAAIAAASDDGSLAMAVSDTKMSDTQTHQAAARKEKQMEKLRVALGIKDIKENELDLVGPDEREEGEVFSGDEDMKVNAHYEDEVKTIKTKPKGGKRKQKNKMKGHRGSQSSDSESNSESDSDRETKRKQRSTKISKKIVRGDSSDSGSESDKGYRGRIKEADRDSRALKRRNSGSESDSSRSSGHLTMKSERQTTKLRHDSDSDNEKSKRQTTKLRHDFNSENENHTDRWKCTVTPDRELPTDSYKTKTKRGDYDGKHEDRHHNRSSKSHTDGRGSRSEKVASERTQRSQKYDDNEFVQAHVQKSELTPRKGGHDSDYDSDIERSRKEHVKGVTDPKGYQKAKEEKMTRNDKEGDKRHDRIDDERSYKNRGVKEDAHDHRMEGRKEEVEHERAKHERREEDGFYKRKPERDGDQMRKLERREEDEYRSKKREREENEQRDVKREKREEDKDGGRRREKREEVEQRVKTREIRDEKEKRDKDGGMREKREGDDQQGRIKEMREGNVKHERREDDKDGARRREKRVEEELGGRKEMRERDVVQERREGSKDRGRKENKDDDEQLGRIRETGEGYTRQARKPERKEEDEPFSKKRERGDEDEETHKKRERRDDNDDDDEHGSRNWEKRGQEEKSRNERKEKDGIKISEAKEDDHRGRRSENKESSRRYHSDVRRRH